MKYPSFLSGFNKTWIFPPQIFKKKTHIKFCENPSRRRWVVPGGQTDKKKLIAVFHNFAKELKHYIINFYVLLTVHPNIIIVFFYQLDAQILYFNTLACSSTCFEHCYAHLQEYNCISTASGIVIIFEWLFSTQVTRGRQHDVPSPEHS